MGKWRMRSAESSGGSDIVTLIGEGTVFTGDLVLCGGARIDGKVVGRINAAALVVVGPSGDIEADELRAHSVTVCGSIHGKLIVEERLEIQPGGRVCGQVLMKKEGLVVSPGGVFEGTVEYTRDAENEASEPREFAIEVTA